MTPQPGAGGTDLVIDRGLVEEVVARLLDRGETIAVAESLTAGLVCAALGSVPGVSAVLRGGVVAYASDLKTSLLGVPAATVAADGVVSEQTARAMAAGVRERCAASWGLATTGVAGPDPQEGKPPGTVYVAVSGPAHDPTGGSVTAVRASGGRQAIRIAAATAALELLLGATG